MPSQRYLHTFQTPKPSAVTTKLLWKFQAGREAPNELLVVGVHAVLAQGKERHFRGNHGSKQLGATQQAPSASTGHSFYSVSAYRCALQWQGSCNNSLSPPAPKGCDVSHQPEGNPFSWLCLWAQSTPLHCFCGSAGDVYIVGSLCMCLLMPPVHRHLCSPVHLAYNLQFKVALP